ncbi:MAG: hypothetical protein K0B15_11935 [Lentimicrobium sp.]|nr:hypothetical protein [Lentimicrobium sp.]
MNIDLTLLKPLDFLEFIDQINVRESKYLDSTGPGEWLEQTIPSIYLRSNEHFKFSHDTAIQGMFLIISSTIEYIIFSFEFHENPFILDLEHSKNKYASFLKIKRSEIIGFKKNEEVRFNAVNPKKSYQLMYNMQGALVGGSFTHALIRGGFRLAGKIEDDIVEKLGIRYSLEYNDNDTMRSIDIICEQFYIDKLDTFLTETWTKEIPILPALNEIKKGGCFIATACYGNYDHPNVIVLRNFRDNVLAKSQFGKLFISLYYFYSPAIAAKIERSQKLKCLILFLLINPLVKLTSQKK